MTSTISVKNLATPILKLYLCLIVLEDKKRYLCTRNYLNDKYETDDYFIGGSDNADTGFLQAGEPAE